MEQSHGQRTRQLIELIDVLPTLVELTQLSLPTNQTYDGVSLVPLLDGSADNTGKNASFSQYAHCNNVSSFPPDATQASYLWTTNQCQGKTGQTGATPPGQHGADRADFYVMGHAMRTDDWRYVEWCVIVF